MNIKLIFDDGTECTDYYKPDGSGQQLSTEKFDTILPNGKSAPSFCADLEAHQVLGGYLFDGSNHNFDDPNIVSLVAALDYINDTFGPIETNKESKAIAQIVIWNKILEVDGNAGFADDWFEDRKIVKIEGNGAWYDKYAVLVDDILANSDYYNSIYDNKSGETYISGLIFIEGDGSHNLIDQQRQIVVLFGDPQFINTLIYP